MEVDSSSGPTRVFVSYAHDSVRHVEAVRNLWVLLRANGVDARLDLSAAERRQDWPSWMMAQVEEADFVIVVVSSAYKRRAEGRAAALDGPGAQFEAALLRELIYRDRRNWHGRILPVLLPGASVEDIPLFLGPYTGSRYEVTELSVAGVERLLRLLTGQPLETEPPVGAKPSLPTRRLDPGEPSGPRGDTAAAVELSSDVVETHRAALEEAGLVLPVRWTAQALSRTVLDQGPSRTSDLMSALCQAAEAKPVLHAIGIGQLELGRLQVIYRREVGAWPNGASADALLVEAADADRSERRRAAAGSLGALARYGIGVAATLSIPPHDHPTLARWIESLGHQVADAQQHYKDRWHAPAWLFIDLGNEPQPSAPGEPRAGTPPWPTQMAWTYFTRQGTLASELTGEVTAVATKAGLAHALTEIFAAVPPAWPLVVDLAMPAGLLREGIEHWPLFPVDDQLESLSDRYRPRLRWSLRRHDFALHGRCADRTMQSDWTMMPKLLTDTLLVDDARLKRWIRNEKGHPWLLGHHPTMCRSDPLRILLREGYGFLIWFRQGGDPHRRRLIADAASSIPLAARRDVIPDELPGLPDMPIVIWDDPRGRGEFELPPPVVAEYISMH